MLDVLAQLRLHAGQGFERYKPSTVRRRVERRMEMHGLPDLAAYSRLLSAQASECSLLFKEMLIGVTSFFRDPEVWQALDEQALKPLMFRGGPDEPVRAWCAGCSTGEEAYSLALRWLELGDQQRAAVHRQPRPLQLFASDLNPDAVQVARSGLYATGRLAGLSAQQQAHHFSPEGDLWRVSQVVRRQVLFAVHDLTSDPPFGRLDLLVCRNLLIYLSSELQQQIIRLFHYCLKPGGLLLLGRTETVDERADLFIPLDRRINLFRRQDTAQARPPMPGTAWFKPDTRLHEIASMKAQEPPEEALPSAAERLVLDRFAPASVLVRRDGDLLWTCGAVDSFLDPVAGRGNGNVLAMADESLRVWLAQALQEVQADNPMGLSMRGLRGSAGSGRLLDVDVVPMPDAAGADSLCMVVLRDSLVARYVESSADTERGGEETNPSWQRDELELMRLRESVRSMQEQLQAANEDYQSTNEELQTSNEELTTSREEMQSMNEELQAINAELRAKLEALALEQNDLKNLLDSTQIATVFLDQSLHVRRFTEQARLIIMLREGDTGRPLSDLTTTLQYPDLVAKAAEVLQSQTPVEREVPTSDGRWFSVRILPYKTVDELPAGVVITFTDTTHSDASQRARLDAAQR